MDIDGEVIGDGPGESSRSAAELPTQNAWDNANENCDPKRSLEYRGYISTEVKSHEDGAMSNEFIDIDGAGSGRVCPQSGRPPSLGAASRVILEGLPEDAGLTPRKKRKDKYHSYQATRLTDDEEVNETKDERQIKDKMLQKKAWTVTADVVRDETDAYIIFIIRDFVIYLIFFSLLLTLVYGPRENAYNHYASVLSDLITRSTYETSIGTARVTQNFVGLRSIKQLWDFINQVLVKVIYMSPSSKILEENILVGAPSIRLIRVKNNTCNTAPLFQDLYKTCYGEYSEDNEEKQPFGERNSSPWNYSDSFAYDSAHGTKNDYTSGGYIMNFTLDSNFTIDWLAELEENNWIGPGSRAVIIDMVLYTPNTNLFLVVKLLAEILTEGGVRTTHSFLTHKFMRYLTPQDYVVMSCEFMFLVFSCYYALEELQQMWLLRRRYLVNWWNALDILIVIMSFCMTYSIIYRYVVTFDKLGDKIFRIGESNHASFDDVSQIDNNFTLTSSFLLFLVWIKLFKFATLNRSVILLLAAIDEVKWELLMVTFILLIITTGFSLLGLTLYGSHVDQYYGFTNSFFSVTSMSVGRLYYIIEMDYAQPTLTFFFISMYSLVVGVLFASTFVALVAYGYHSTHLALDDVGILDRQYMGDLVYSLYIAILTFFGRDRLVSSYRLRDQRQSHRADYDAFVTLLKRYGWTLTELRLFLKSHRMYRGEELELSELVEIYNEFWLRNQLFVEVEAHNEIREQLKEIGKTTEFCEQAIVDIMSKTDVLADRALKNSRLKPGIG